jgi:hypothetical protein
MKKKRKKEMSTLRLMSSARFRNYSVTGWFLNSSVPGAGLRAHTTAGPL